MLRKIRIWLIRLVAGKSIIYVPPGFALEVESIELAGDTVTRYGEAT